MHAVSNPRIPKLYSFIKLHKEENPIRTVVSFIYSPSHNLSNELDVILRNTLNFKPKFSIKNSLDLIDKVKNIKINRNSILLSFDVKNLFPSVDPVETINLVESYFLEEEYNH